MVKQGLKSFTTWVVTIALASFIATGIIMFLHYLGPSLGINSPFTDPGRDWMFWFFGIFSIAGAFAVLLMKGVKMRTPKQVE